MALGETTEEGAEDESVLDSHGGTRGEIWGCSVCGIAHDGGAALVPVWEETDLKHGEGGYAGGAVEHLAEERLPVGYVSPQLGHLALLIGAVVDALRDGLVDDAEHQVVLFKMASRVEDDVGVVAEPHETGGDGDGLLEGVGAVGLGVGADGDDEAVCVGAGSLEGLDARMHSGSDSGVNA